MRRVILTATILIMSTWELLSAQDQGLGGGIDRPAALTSNPVTPASPAETSAAVNPTMVDLYQNEIMSYTFKAGLGAGYVYRGTFYRSGIGIDAALLAAIKDKPEMYTRFTDISGRQAAGFALDILGPTAMSTGALLAFGNTLFAIFDGFSEKPKGLDPNAIPIDLGISAAGTLMTTIGIITSINADNDALGAAIEFNRYVAQRNVRIADFIKNDMISVEFAPGIGTALRYRDALYSIVTDGNELLKITAIDPAVQKALRVSLSDYNTSTTIALVGLGAMAGCLLLQNVSYAFGSATYIIYGAGLATLLVGSIASGDAISGIFDAIQLFNLDAAKRADTRL